jgi:hypothetical protein
VEFELRRIGIFFCSIWRESPRFVICGAIGVAVMIYAYAVDHPVAAQTAALIAAVFFFRALTRAWLMNRIRKAQLLADNLQSESGRPDTR